MVCGGEYGNAWKTLGAYQGLGMEWTSSRLQRCQAIGPRRQFPGEGEEGAWRLGEPSRDVGRGRRTLLGTKVEKAESVINVAAEATRVNKPELKTIKKKVLGSILVINLSVTSWLSGCSTSKDHSSPAATQGRGHLLQGEALEPERQPPSRWQLIEVEAAGCFCF